MKRFALAAFLLCAAAPAQAQDAIARLRADLLGGHSATEVLTQRCADLGLANPPVIKAVVASGVDHKATPQIRALLQAGSSMAVRYRKVDLMCGSYVLSQADNWYLPGRLTPQMNRQLDSTDTSFGTVVRPLGFHRQTLAVSRDTARGFVLQIRALLLNRAGAPFSLVVEHYRRELVAH